MIRVAIVEDDPSEAGKLTEFLQRYAKESGVEIGSTHFPTADIFLSRYQAGYDLCLMDIEMPGTDGMEAAKKLRRLDKSIILIFVTNLAQYAIKGYEVDAKDYFLKPVRYHDLKMRMESICKLLEAKDLKLSLPSEEGLRFVNLRDVLYIESDNHTLIYHTVHGTFQNRDKSMKQIEAEFLPYGFARCSVGYLVNLKYCTAVQKNTVLVGAEQLPISRAKRKEFLDALISSFKF